ncbi:MAG: sigma 54-interacting transcriptional regulator [Desulfovibrio sp.]|nr:sigma 54-interacting transcriptional regulator [Desulfovibrio sp.]
MRNSGSKSGSSVSRGTAESFENQVRLLSALAELVTTSAPLDATLHTALGLMARYLHMMRGAVTLISPSSGEIRIEAAYGLKPAEARRGRYALGEGITGRVIETGRPMFVSQVSREPRFLNRTRSRNLGKEDVSFICVPILLQNQVVGAISVDRLLADEATLAEEMRLLAIIATLLSHVALETQGHMDDAETQTSRPRGFVGNCEAIRLVYEQIAIVAPSTSTVLLHGESGTGKELAARAIHAASECANGPFVSVNCAALPENLIESELFGYERGAFTGATAMRKGRFELAEGGTLFLDEIGELSLLTQAKLLRVLQECAFERLGGSATIRVNTRFITATNRDLEAMVAAGTFRRDLFYRLNVFPILLPPLRCRQEDILPLAHHFAVRFSQRNGRGSVRLSLAVMEMLQRYAWPGNIRELENVMERAVLLVGRAGLILPRHLPPAVHGDRLFATQAADAAVTRQRSGSLQEQIEELERAAIVEALEASRGHVGKAAERLGLTERIVALRMKKYGISYKTFREELRGQGGAPQNDH